MARSWYAQYQTLLGVEWPTQEAKDDALATLEAEYPGRASRLRARVTSFFLIVIYAVGGLMWGCALHIAPLWFSLGGAAIGTLLGLRAGAIIRGTNTLAVAMAAQSMAGLFFGLPGVILGGVGLVVWLVRAALFH